MSPQRMSATALRRHPSGLRAHVRQLEAPDDDGEQDEDDGDDQIRQLHRPRIGQALRGRQHTPRLRRAGSRPAQNEIAAEQRRQASCPGN